MNKLLPPKWWRSQDLCSPCFCSKHPGFQFLRNWSFQSGMFFLQSSLLPTSPWCPWQFVTFTQLTASKSGVCVSVPLLAWHIVLWNVRRCSFSVDLNLLNLCLWNLNLFSRWKIKTVLARMPFDKMWHCMMCYLMYWTRPNYDFASEDEEMFCVVIKKETNKIFVDGDQSPHLDPIWRGFSISKYGTPVMTVSF